MSPSQEVAFRSVLGALEVGKVVHLHGGVGCGKSRLLEALAAPLDAHVLGVRRFLDVVGRRGSGVPEWIEDIVFAVVSDALHRHACVMLDDFHLLDLGSDCTLYPRRGYMRPVGLALCELAQAMGRTLVFTTTGRLTEPALERSHGVTLERFKPEDYRAISRGHLGAKAEALDVTRIFRFAPKLNGHQLKAACLWIDRHGGVTTDGFIDFLRTRKLASNVNLEEVQAFDLSDLKGVDDVLRSLEINVVLPLQHDTLAQQLELRPKRGVLLHGPPGTGKTTIGRALAHRLKGKFFLIDGTFISGTRDFYARVNEVFEAARDNAPSIVFFDDADTIFEDSEDAGLYRYLLTKLDGLEGDGSSQVCVMLTAMNVAHLPPALIRSGRVELWLEMRLPDASARTAIFESLFGRLPAALRPEDLTEVVAITEGFTGADLKRVVEDAKSLYAYDLSRKTPVRPAAGYYGTAVELVRQNKEAYIAAEAKAVSERRLRGPNPFGLGSCFTELAEA